MKKLIFLLCLWAVPAFAQYHVVDIMLTETGFPVNQGKVRVCTSAALPVVQGAIMPPCSPLATVYSDDALTVPKTNPVVTTSRGNYDFWVHSATTYVFQFFQPNSTMGTQYEIVIPAAASDVVPVTGTPHNLLSVTHLDTTPYSPPNLGDLIMGDASHKWSSFPGNTTTTPKWMMSIGDGAAVTSEGFFGAGGPCPTGQYETGINANLTPVCADLPAQPGSTSTPPAPFTIPAGQAVAWSFPSTCFPFEGSGHNVPFNPSAIGTFPTDATVSCGLNGGVVTRFGSGPLHDYYDFGMVWSGFSVPTMPNDAVIQHIYPVTIATRYGSNLIGSSIIVCGADTLVSEGGTYGGYFSNSGSLGNTTSSITSATCSIDSGSSLGLTNGNDTQVVQLIGLAVYYTTATPPTNSTNSFFAIPYYPSLNGLSIPFSSISDGSPLTYNAAFNFIVNRTATLNHLTATRALNATNLQNGGRYTLEFIQDSTGGASVTAGTGCTWINAKDGSSYTPSINTAANSRSTIRWAYDGTYCIVDGGGSGSSIPYPSAGLAASTGSAWRTPLASDVISLFGSCSGTQYLGADGLCHTVPGGGNVSTLGLTTNTIPKATGTTAIGNSLLSDDGTQLTYTGTGGMAFPGAILDQGTKQAGTSVTLDAGMDGGWFLGSDNLFHCQLSAALGGGSCLPASVNGSGTTNTLPKFTASATVGNSLLSDDGTTATYTGTGGINAKQVVIPGATSGTITLVVPTVAGTHTITFPAVTGTVVLGTGVSGNCAQWTATGLGDAGAPCGSGSGGTPGGSNTQLQYNNAGAFGGAQYATYDNANKGITTGDGTTRAILDQLGASGAPSNPAANTCRQYFDTTAGVTKWINSSGTSCGPATGSTTTPYGTLLWEATASSSATLDCATRNATGQSGACIQTDYDEYVIEVLNVCPVSGSTDFLLEVSKDGGSTWDTTSGHYTAGACFGYSSAGTTNCAGTISTAIRIAGYAAGRVGNCSNAADSGVSATIRLTNPLSTTLPKQFRTSDVALFDTAIPGNAAITQTPFYNQTGAGTGVNALRFIESSGNLASGTVRIYGVAK